MSDMFFFQQDNYDDNVKCPNDIISIVEQNGVNFSTLSGQYTTNLNPHNFQTNYDNIGGDFASCAKFFPVGEPDKRLIPFYFEDVSGQDNVVKVSKEGVNEPYNIIAYYSYDNKEWNDIVLEGEREIPLPANGRVYLKADTAFWSIGPASSSPRHGMGFRRGFNGPFKIGGNIMSLLYGAEFTGNETTFRKNTSGYYPATIFRYLFFGNTNLVDASELVIPVMQFPDDETENRRLSNIYDGMFQGCANLVEGPVLMQPKIEHQRYRAMFNGCGSLKTITCLATEYATRATDGWVRDVSPEGVFRKPKNATFWYDIEGNINRIPDGWEVVDL